MLATPSASLHDVPALLDTSRFQVAALRSLGEWVYFIQLAEWRRRGQPRWLPDPCLGATLAEDLLTHGPALWQHVRSAFSSYYEGGYEAEQPSAEHRFWALLRLRDLRTEPLFQPWISQEQPYWFSPELVLAAAEARLTLWHACIDDPMDERSSFDLDDLLARLGSPPTQADRARAKAEEQAFLAAHSAWRQAGRPRVL